MYDVIIIGRGPAGVSSSLYTTRSNLKTLIIGKNDSLLRKSDKIDNYYGFAKGIDGESLLKEGEKQTLRLGTEIIEDQVIDIKEEGTGFEVFTTVNSYTSKSVIISTGYSYTKVKIKDLEKYEGMGISYCTTCDGFFYRNKKVGIIGYKDYAVHEANELKIFTEDITIFTNGNELDLSEKYSESLGDFTINKKTIKRFKGTDSLEGLVFEDDTEKDLNGIFIAYGNASSTDFARKLGITVKGNFIEVDKEQKTNIPGVFAAGDCTGGFRQIATAVGEGAIAGKSAIDYVRGKSS